MHINDVIELNEDLRKVKETLTNLADTSGKYHVAYDSVQLLNKHINETQKEIDSFNAWADEQAEIEGAAV